MSTSANNAAVGVTARPPLELDALDLRILEVLQADASLTNQELAARVNASAPTCLRRVRRLRELGVIDRIVAILAPEKVGKPLTAIVEITLDVQTSEAMEAFEEVVRGEPAIAQCYRVSSGPDFIVIAVVRDMAAYHELVRRTFTRHANVRNVRTFFAIHQSKFDTRVL
mgnify:CR=1 FL=1